MFETLRTFVKRSVMAKLTIVPMTNETRISTKVSPERLRWLFFVSVELLDLLIAVIGFAGNVVWKSVIFISLNLVMPILLRAVVQGDFGERNLNRFGP